MIIQDDNLYYDIKTIYGLKGQAAAAAFIAGIYQVRKAIVSVTKSAVIVRIKGERFIIQGEK